MEFSYNFVRGSTKSLGKEYTKERIRERIENKANPKSVLKKKTSISDRLIDTSGEKFQNSPGLKKWADVQNLKLAAQTYLEAGSIAKLEQKFMVKSEAANSAKQTILQMERQLKTLGEILKYTQQYQTNRPYYLKYKKAKNPDTVFRKYESQILLYGGAKRMLEQAGIDLKSLNVDKLKSEYLELEKQKNEMSVTYKAYQKEAQEMYQKLETLKQYIGQETDKKQEQKTLISPNR